MSGDRPVSRFIACSDFKIRFSLQPPAKKKSFSQEVRGLLRFPLTTTYHGGRGSSAFSALERAATVRERSVECLETCDALYTRCRRRQNGHHEKPQSRGIRVTGSSARVARELARKIALSIDPQRTGQRVFPVSR